MQVAVLGHSPVGHVGSAEVRDHRRVSYRPSRASKILRIAEEMDSDLKDMTFEVVDGKRTPASVLSEDLRVEEKRESCLSTELSQYRATTRNWEGAVQKQFLTSWRRAATLGYRPRTPIPSTRRLRRGTSFRAFRRRGYRTGSGYRDRSGARVP